MVLRGDTAAFAEGPGRRRSRRGLIVSFEMERFVSGGDACCGLRLTVWRGGRPQKGEHPTPAFRLRRTYLRRERPGHSAPGGRLRTRSLFCRIMSFLSTRIRIPYPASVAGRTLRGAPTRGAPTRSVVRTHNTAGAGERKGAHGAGRTGCGWGPLGAGFRPAPTARGGMTPTVPGRTVAHCRSAAGAQVAT
jgi:hypothetical protein